MTTQGYLLKGSYVYALDLFQIAQRSPKIKGLCAILSPLLFFYE